MQSKPRIIAVSQRVVEVGARGEVRDCLDQAWTIWLQTMGFCLVPVPNQLTSLTEFLHTLRPVGIILSGGNNLTLPVYDGTDSADPMVDAFQSRDQTEHTLVQFALQEKLPLLGCCRGMQFIQAFFGGRLSSLKNSSITHVAKPHPIAFTDERFRSMAGAADLTVNSFHNYGIRREDVARPLEPFALASGEMTVEGFSHRDAPIVGIMWHPERSNPAASFDQKLVAYLFGSDSFAQDRNPSPNPKTT